MEKPIDEITVDEISETQNVDTTFNDDQRTSDKEIEEEKNVAGEDTQDTDNFSELYEESLKSIQEGEVVKGEIVQVDKEYVLVDIGYKSEGQISIQEFIDSEGDLLGWGTRKMLFKNGEKMPKDPSGFPKKKQPKSRFGTRSRIFMRTMAPFRAQSSLGSGEGSPWILAFRPSCLAHRWT